MSRRRNANAGLVGVVCLASLAACGETSAGRDGPGPAGSGAGGENGETCTVREGSTKTDEPCAGLDRMTITGLGIVDEDGDGRIAPGEAFTASFELRDNSGFGFAAYPGVKYAVEPAGALLSPDSDFAAYALYPCETMRSGTRVSFEPALGAGTIIELTARAAALNRDCPHAPSSAIRVKVE